MQVKHLEVYNFIHNHDHGGMNFFERLKKHLEDKGLSIPKLSYASAIPSGHIYQWGSGKRSPSDNDLKKLSEVAEIGLSYTQLKAWAMLDRFEPEELEVLKQELKDYIEERKKRGN